jgi:hypothetical protein
MFVIPSEARDLQFGPISPAALSAVAISGDQEINGYTP